MKKEKRGHQNQMKKLRLAQKKWCISEFHPLPPFEGNVCFFNRFYKNLTRFWTKLRVLVLCFRDFTENSTFIVVYTIPTTIQTWNYRLHAIIWVVVVADGPALNPRALTNYEI
jgi:hypothetical protein